MRSAAILLPMIALVACNSADAQGKRSGQTLSRDVQVGAFESVALAGAYDVVVRVGGPSSVRVEGDSGLMESLEITVEGGTLKVGHKKGTGSWFGRDDDDLTVYVTMPRIVSAAVAGSGDMSVDRVEGERFAAAVAGSGDLDIAAIRVTTAKFSIAGSGDIEAAGNAESVEASIAGSGDIDIVGLESRRASISIVGSGNVDARAMDSASLSIMGSGNASVSGTAKCTISKRGSGEARCG